MATPIPYRYAVDETGTNPDNLVENEPHVLDAKLYRTIAPKYGAYFTKNVHVWDSLTHRELRRGIDYKCLDIVGLPSARNKDEICSTILVVDQSCSSNVLVTYQALGGPYERSFPGIATLINNVYNDTRPALWESVIGKPSSFNPTDHMHDFGDVVGLEYVINGLERIRQAILLGDEVDNVELVAYFDAQLLKLKQALALQIESEAYQATLIAQQAKSDAQQALAAFSAQNATIGELSNQVFQASARASALSSDFLTDEALARTLLSTYPGLSGLADSMSLIQNPNMTPATPSVFPQASAVGLYASDTVYVRNTGELVYADPSLSPPQVISGGLCASVRLSLIKELGTGRAVIQLSIALIDQRDHTAFLGEFGDEGEVTIWPLLIGAEAGRVAEVFSGETSHRVYSSASDGSRGSVTYEVMGSMPVSLTDSAVAGTTDDVVLGDSLMDVRKDLNISGYAGSVQRKPVKFKLAAGNEVNLFFRLSSVSLAEVLRTVSAVFQLKVKVKSQTASGIATLKQIDMTAKPRTVSGSFA